MTNEITSEMIDILVLINAIPQANSLDELEKLKLQLLGKSGLVTKQLDTLRTLSGNARMEEGKRLNVLKKDILSKISQKKEALSDAKDNFNFAQTALDATIPVPAIPQGTLHPLWSTIWEITDIFKSMGFSMEKGPEIETDHYNFTSLRIPPHHPARACQDTFYMSKPLGKDTQLLRTQTSPGQIRIMEKQSPPLRVVIPGRVYRVDEWDATHSPMFHQIEGFAVDKGIHMGHLKGTLQEMFDRFFSKKMEIRFRPSFFPFTEPSAEVDIKFHKKGQASTSQGEWLEVLGCGMIHREILENLNIDTNVYRGFAFGIGIERLAMLKYGIEDLRNFFENDQRWLRHYGRNPRSLFEFSTH